MGRAGISEGSMRAQLADCGFSPTAIEEAIAREFGGLRNAASTEARVVAPRAFPIRITLPWSALVSDNRKYAAQVMSNGQTKYPKLVMTEQYRAAKTKAAQIARRVYGTEPPLDYPLSMHARVWVPDNRAGHDVTNFAKCAQDAMQGIVYKNDAQLHRVVWERVGVDVDQPRAEIELQPL